MRFAGTVANGRIYLYGGAMGAYVVKFQVALCWLTGYNSVNR